MKITTAFILVISVLGCTNQETREMGWFRKNNQKAEFNIEAILNQKDEADIVMAIADYLNAKSDYGSNMAVLTEAQKVLLIVYDFEGEVNNGGFNQFYFNSTGDYSHETVEALLKIGAVETAEVVKRANSQFPNSEVPKDRTKRQELLFNIEDKAKVTWEECDNKIFRNKEYLSGFLVEFTKKNKTEFEK
jgi:hypothetical protein